MQRSSNAADPFQPVAKRRVALALQGGGSHGAFTWGVLDRVLMEPSLEIVGVSGTSAGAMNAGCSLMACAEAEPRRPG
jgi:NTE family protein